MGRLTQQQLQAPLEFVRDCYAWHDLDSFTAHLFRALPKLIPSEVTSYNEIDFGSGRLLDAQILARFAEAVRPGLRPVPDTMASALRTVITRR